MLISLAVSFGVNKYNNQTNMVLTQTYERDENIPEDPGIAKKYYYNGKLKKAEKIYENIVNKNPEDIESIMNLIILKKELGKLKESIPYYRQLIKISPDNMDYHYGIGVTYFQIGSYEEAKKELNFVYKQIKNSKNSLESREKALLYNYLGEIYYNLNEMEKAQKFFQTGIKEYPYITLNYLGLAKVYDKENNINEKIKLYKKALEKDYSLAYLYPEIATGYEFLGDKEAAYYYWKRSLNTGNKVNIARKKINEFQEKFPEYIEQEEEIKKESRVNIKWSTVEPITNEKDIPKIRVGLAENVDSITFQAGTSFKILLKGKDNILIKGQGKIEWTIKLDKGKYYIYSGNKLVKAIDNKKNSLILELDDKKYTFALYDISYGQGYFWAGSEDRQFRGAIELFNVNNDKFNVINIVNLEEYLFSVVPSEMPAWWPEEALKAQVIAARSYALAHLGKHSSDGFDLCSTVHCAVYSGVGSENSRTNKAILDTIGEVGMYEGKIIDAVFSSNSGGYSESSYDVWGTKIPYLVGANNMVNLQEKFPLPPYKLNDLLLNDYNSFSGDPTYAGYNKYRWIKLVPDTYFLHNFKLKSLKNIIPLERSKGGSVKKIIIYGEEKQVTLSKDIIRSKLGGLRSNRFIIEKRFNSDGTINEVIFYGSGWGHNVGMDQTAAAGMAERGYTYKDIIKHFYKGSNIEKIY